MAISMPRTYKLTWQLVTLDRGGSDLCVPSQVKITRTAAIVARKRSEAEVFVVAAGSSNNNEGMDCLLLYLEVLWLLRTSHQFGKIRQNKFINYTGLVHVSHRLLSQALRVPYMRSIVLTTLLLGIILSGCTKPASREDELSYLRTVVPEALLENAHLELGSVKSVAIKGEGENQYLGLHIFPGQSKVHGGIRAEISVGYPFQQGEIVSYSWRFMLPKDFASDAPKNR
jgi:hypothetical protein